ncbi:helix-turn-helix transcriptional regulator [Alkaliphilus peptidifermentans]|uniref:Predicted DNA-binding transcriptional regulator YafY, contains an HTH and WYL domains n=1 Tax=Alkaliphilus peptidifermentans DSM 18978 TaxID=1120976 RepID=A0A1G5L5M0_9FIRM|nr:YafY family protein [Alkaliphilus peptidifermentans]SCZ07741.1 Predicted DNA-binding transcriptional regulator YafY, contains an HTH and WYL domains [Alkaliphilus peptidifermentans DSM 18978]
MGKSERINDMMIYLNSKNYFNLKDIMERYDISKSTALRDIKSLEEIGMPIFSEAGRNGRYGILRNRLLSPIVFTIDEMYALYFAMITLKGYESTPFHLSVSTLKNKFETCISNEHISTIRKMEQILSFEVLKHHNSSPLLRDILKMAVEQAVCKITYNKKGTATQFFVQFFNVSASYGQWYVTAFNFDTNKVQVFRCDKIITLDESTVYSSKPIKELTNLSANAFRHKGATDFEVGILSKGVDLFYKEHYPSMQLHIEGQQYIIRGFYNKGEENFIANYFLNYTDNIISIKPQKLKKLLQDKICILESHYKNL